MLQRPQNLIEKELLMKESEFLIPSNDQLSARSYTKKEQNCSSETQNFEPLSFGPVWQKTNILTWRTLIDERMRVKSQ